MENNDKDIFQNEENDNSCRDEQVEILKGDAENVEAENCEDLDKGCEARKEESADQSGTNEKEEEGSCCEEEASFEEEGDLGSKGEDDNGQAEADIAEEEKNFSSSYAPPHYVPVFSSSGAEADKRKNKDKNSGTLVITVLCCLALSFVVGAFAGFLGTILGEETKAIIGKDDSIDIIKNDGSINVNQIIGSTGDSNLTVAEVAAKVSKSVVEIEVINSGAAGSGVIFSQTDKFGYVVTNYHVVEGGKDIKIRLTTGKEYVAEYLDGDNFSDIAVLRVEKESNEVFVTAVFGSSGNLCVGEEVVAIGNPLGTLGGTVTNGIISALDRQILVDSIPMVLLQHNAAINSGNSGGGLFNMAGELVGIVNAKKAAEGIEGLGFAIPIDLVSSSISEILDKGYISGRPTIGVEVEYGSLNVWTPKGVYIVSTTNSSFKKYDKIVSIDGEEISSILDYYTAMDSSKIGKTIKVVVERDGRSKTIEVKVEEYKPQSIK